MPEPTPRDRQIADFLAAERLREQVDTCIVRGHLLNDREDLDKCTRCGRFLQEGFDYEPDHEYDIPF